MPSRDFDSMSEQRIPLTDAMVLLGGQTVLYFASCGLGAVGLLLVVVGVATPEWTSMDVEYHDRKILRNSKGLWRYCTDDVCVDVTGDKPDSLVVCETCGLLSVLAGAICLGLLLAHIILQSFKKRSRPCFLTLAMSSGICSAVFIAVTASVWAAKHHTGGPNIYFGYSSVLTVIGGALLSISGFLGWFSSRSHMS